MFNLNNVLNFLEREIKDNLVVFIGLLCWILKITSVRLFGHLLKE